jgi:hypothetical protein
MPSLNCPRCGKIFQDNGREPLPWRRDSRLPKERFIDHAQREHDLGEHEALTLLEQRPG